MSYLVLARKYRPQKFAEVIGQEHITKTLENSILAKRIAHAYLFSGPRGTGKTTTARIFAKGLNCASGPTAEPCQNCVSCKEITQGNSVDVFEIDAASNRGIEEIRALRENVRFAPAACRYKIYIIDEAHQITPEAFNALLKTLEEPPAYVIFIFATTEPQKVPVTILSRCQRFAFRLVSVEKISQRLEEIVKKENISVEPEAINFIAHLAQGSVRDAESLLDEGLSFSPQGVKVKDLVFLLNLLPQEYLIRFGDAFLSLDKQKVLDLIAEVNDLGYNLQQVVKDLREYSRQLLLLKFSAGEVLGLPEEIKINLSKESGKFSFQLLSRYISLLSRCLEEMKWSDQPRIIFETYALKMANQYFGIDEIMERVEDLEKSLSREVASGEKDSELLPPAAEEPDTGEFGKTETVSRKTVEKPLLPQKVDPLQAKKASPSAAEDTLPLEMCWTKLLEEIKKKKFALFSYLEFAQPKEFRDNVLTVVFGQNFSLEGAEKSSVFIEKVWKELFSQEIRLVLVIGKSEPMNRGVIASITEEPEIEMPKETFTLVEEKTKNENQDTSLDPVMKKIFKHFPQAEVVKAKKE